MDKFFGSVDTRNGIHFPVLPTTYCDELSYLEVVSKLIELVNELIEQCNLNTNNKIKLQNEWRNFEDKINEKIKTLETDTETGRKLLHEINEFISGNTQLINLIINSNSV